MYVTHPVGVVQTADSVDVAVKLATDTVGEPERASGVKVVNSSVWVGVS